MHIDNKPNGRIKVKWKGRKTLKKTLQFGQSNFMQLEGQLSRWAQVNRGSQSSPNSFLASFKPQVAKCLIKNLPELFFLQRLGTTLRLQHRGQRKI